MAGSTSKRFSRCIAVSLLLIGHSLVPQLVLAGDGSVRIGGQVVLVNQVGADGLKPDQETQAIQRKLDNALVAANDRSPQSVQVVYVKGLPVVTLGGYEVAVVSNESAKLSKTTPALLAQKWANGIRKALTDTASVNVYVNQLMSDAQGPQVSGSAVPGNGTASQSSSSEASGASAESIPYQPGPATNYGQEPPAARYDQAPAAAYGQPSATPYRQTPAAGYVQPPPTDYGQPPAMPYRQPAPGQYGSSPNQPGWGNPVRRGRVVYAPAGLTISVTLSTAIATNVARPGDMIEAQISQSVPLDSGMIPAGSTVIGQVTEAEAGRHFSRSGALSITFTKLRTPDGSETPISGHLVGQVGKYAEKQNNQLRGEGWGTKAGAIGLRGLLGAGGGAALGTAIGAIAGRSGAGAGRGAWSGAAIGGGAGLLEGALLRKGREVLIRSGTPMQFQLDQPATISVPDGPMYNSGNL